MDIILDKGFTLNKVKSAVKEEKDKNIFYKTF